jgi:hypothetical protein
MRKITLVMAVAACWLSLGLGSALAATSVKVPLVLSGSAQTDIQGCIGETVTVTGGTFNVVADAFATPSGGVHFLFRRNIMEGTLTGDSTGTPYAATGHLQVIDNLFAGGESFTFELTLSVVGMADAGSFTAHIVERFLVGPSGELVLYKVPVESIRCG